MLVASRSRSGADR